MITIGVIVLFVCLSSIYSQLDRIADILEKMEKKP